MAVFEKLRGGWAETQAQQMWVFLNRDCVFGTYCLQRGHSDGYEKCWSKKAQAQQMWLFLNRDCVFGTYCLQRGHSDGYEKVEAKRLSPYPRLQLRSGVSLGSLTITGDSWRGSPKWQTYYTPWYLVIMPVKRIRLFHGQRSAKRHWRNLRTCADRPQCWHLQTFPTIYAPHWCQCHWSGAVLYQEIHGNDGVVWICKAIIEQEWSSFHG